MTTVAISRFQAPPDDAYRIVRSHISAIRQQHRTILKSLIAINEITKQLDAELRASLERDSHERAS